MARTAATSFAPVNPKQPCAALPWERICLKIAPNSLHSLHFDTKDNYGQHGQHKLVVCLHRKFTSRRRFQSMLFSFMQITIVEVSRLAHPGNDKRFYSHDSSVMSRWHDDGRIIAIQPMVICFSLEKQVSVAPKDVCRPSIFFFPHHHPLALAVIKSPFGLYFITGARRTLKRK